MYFCTCGAYVDENEFSLCPKCKTPLEKPQPKKETVEVDNQERCPSCGTPGSLIPQDGCSVCTACGYNACEFDN